MDLIGTASLPVAIALTYTLIVNACLHPPTSFTEAIPLMLLVAVIGLPGVLILLATRKVVYVLWMLIYLIALPIWNFVLPVYAFWHFDDFSWGETRKVEGEAKDKGHIDDTANIAFSVPLRRWEDWERSRLRKLKREARRRADLERQFGKGIYNDEKDHADQYLDPHRASHKSLESFSDSASDFDEDRWGAQIGGYDESQPPPPLAIVRHSMWAEGDNAIVGARDMEEMLEKGWDEDERTPPLQSWQKEHSFSPYPPPLPSIPPKYGVLSKPLPPQHQQQQHHQGPPPPLNRPTREASQVPAPGPRGPSVLHQHRQPPHMQANGNGNANANPFADVPTIAVTSGVDRNVSGGYPQHARNRSGGQNVQPNPSAPTDYSGMPPHMNNQRMQYPR